MRRTFHRIIRTGAFLVAGLLFLSLGPFSCKRFEAEQIVIVETGSASDISYRSCRISAQVYDAGTGGIDQHGVVWSLSKEPVLEGGFITELGPRDNVGSYESSVGELEAGTTYYFRAYGTAGEETSYGKEIQLSTLSPAEPVVSTAEVTGIALSSAVSGGEVSSDRGAEVTARGVCWNLTGAPTLEDSVTVDSSGVGVFASEIQNLDPGTGYFLRAYATNSVGTAYGEERSFTTTVPDPVLPSVTTGSVLDISDSTASCSGTVDSDGGAMLTARGFCWSQNNNPTILDDTTWNGSGLGVFSATLKGLECNTTYYFKAYVTNSVGTAYGSLEEFSTVACPVFLPEVSTLAAYDISDSVATSGGTVLDDGGAAVSSRGVCWGKKTGPTPEGPHSEDGEGTGGFSSRLSDLDPLSTYYYRAYAENSKGIAYGDEYQFSTPERPNTLMDIDGNVYRTVQIGEQTWMAENLRVSRYADGSELPYVTDQPTWGGLYKTEKAFCAYAYDSANFDIYGALYTWAGAMNGAASSDSNPSGVQGACPDGWHLPMTLDQADSLQWRGAGYGAMLKDTSGLWKEPNLANNASGFSALPAGRVNTAGTPVNKTLECYFWSSTDWSMDGEIWYRYLKFERDEIYRYTGFYVMEGYSVRCVKD